MRSGRAAHAVWAAIAVCVSLLTLLAGSKGHPPLVIFLPAVLMVWAAGHSLIWGAGWLARKGQSAARGTEQDAAPRPIGLWLALAGSGIVAAVGVYQLLMTGYLGRLYPYRYPGLWTMMLAMKLAHAACFAGLLLRRRWARLGSAGLAIGWAALLASQIAEHLPPGPRTDATEMTIAIGLMVSLLALGLNLGLSRKVRAFLRH